MTKVPQPLGRGFFPQPAYIVGCLGKDGRPNFTTITWMTFCSINPPSLMFSTRRAKRTPSLILEVGTFSANLATAGMVNLVDFLGTHSGWDVDKAARTGLAWSRGQTLDVPVIERSPLAFECRLAQVAEQGDNIIIFGEVRGILAEENVLDPSGAVDMAKADPLIFGRGGYYRLGPRIMGMGEGAGVFGNIPLHS